MQAIDTLMNEFVAPLEGVASYLERIPAGKRLRSKLILVIAGENNESFLLCAVVEMIHLASLLHDDVIDDSLLRRGTPTISASEGSKNAIMIGDIFYSTAYSKLVTLGEDIASVISEAVAKLSLGELIDVKLSRSFNTDRSKYENMIYLKTAALIEAACEAAAIIAKRDRAAYREFGKKLGIAFQIIDDLLDITQDEKTLGKPALNDLSEGKVTLPLIDLYHLGGEIDRTKLTELFAKPVSPTDAQWLKTRLEACGALERCQTYANRLLTEAKSLVDGETELLAIADKLVRRIS